MKKNAFSYLELIICMSVIVIAIMLSAPVLTGTSNKETGTYGEFRCFSELNGGVYKLYQQQRYNTHSLSEKKEVEKCIFIKPPEAATFTVTIYGGGGGGASAVVDNVDYNQIKEKIINNNEVELSISSAQDYNKVKEKIRLINAKNYTNHVVDFPASTYYYRFIHDNNNAREEGLKVGIKGYLEKEIQRIIKIKTGLAGFAGQKKERTISADVLAEETEIYLCANATGSTLLYEYANCVGRGGKGSENGLNLLNYYLLSETLQDYIHHYKYSSKPHVGKGDGKINTVDVNNLNTIYNSTNHGINLTNGYSDSVYYTLKDKLGNLKVENNNKKDSHGHDGEYTRFKISKKEDYIVAYGGSGARTNRQETEIVKLPLSKPDAEGYYTYIIEGEKGENNNKTYGGKCICSKEICKYCDGKDALQIAAGGDAGSVAYRTNQDLNTYKVVSFLLNQATDIELGEEYHLVYEGDKTEITDFTPASNQNEVINNTYYLGRGGNGGGGAIIINW